MKKIILLILIFTIIFPLSYITADENDTEKNTIEFYPLGKKAEGNAASLSFNGKIYKNDFWIGEISKKNIKLTKDENFICNAISINKNGTKEEFLNLWLPEERQEIAAMINDKDNFEQNKNFYQFIDASAFRVKILYGSYIIFLIQHSGEEPFKDFIKEYIIIRKGDAYYFTNQLMDDSILQFFGWSYSKNLPLIKRNFVGQKEK